MSKSTLHGANPKETPCVFTVYVIVTVVTITYAFCAH